MRRLAIASAIVLGLLVAASTIQPVRPQTAEAASWTAWGCFTAVSVYLPSDQSTLSGQACSSFWTGDPVQMRVWADTSASYSYQVLASASAYESCNGGAVWILRVTKTNVASWTTYTTSGTGQMTSNECPPGSSHVYGVGSGHLRKLSSNDNWEGGSSSP